MIEDIGKYPYRDVAVNNIYHPYLEKHIGNKKIGNILVCGGNGGGVAAEIDRHKHLDYEKIYHYEMMKYNIEYDYVIEENILNPQLEINNVNVIFADVGGGAKHHEKMMWDGTEGMIRILHNSFINNKLGIVVFVFFDGVGMDVFLDKTYGDYKSKDFFTTEVIWDDHHTSLRSSQRLDGVVFC